ncbi:sulfite reductase (NADPH) flavoprotein alpha-component [Paraburkholderia unamae]|uniref:sulfite reductase subunit alpha n=1 Tax=Paraburkholderia unamae TaxID=219649 RepID=UPI000DC299DA|nr:sulfite reductase subunit alpha [Paraburkholderia unamae]RAR48694.1 sulfite reductase (NADPH) flavoprotein alpha-component [Paraburkholderia unamae]
MKARALISAPCVAWTLALASAALAWWSPLRLVSAAFVLLAYCAACVALVAQHRRRARGVASQTARDDLILIAYASQTGFAEQLAKESAAHLEAGGTRTRVASLGALSVADLAAHTRALFVVSTTGEGEAPDQAAPFVRHALRAHGMRDTLATLRFGVLALGDRRYRDYCAFGHRLSAWLIDRRAQPMFETIEVNNGAAAALHAWQAQLAGLCNGVTQAAWSAQPDSVWTLDTRTLLNPGSAGAGAYHLGLLAPNEAALDWRAGDIAEIQPRHARATVQRWLDAHGLDGATNVHCESAPVQFADALATRCLPDVETTRQSAQAWIDRLQPLARRSYSIASVPADGRLELLVRQARWDDCGAPGGHRLGLASGWLTEHAGQGEAITLRVRPNRAFHAPGDDRPLILIGNGTGLAGLRAHLKSRVREGHARNWLIFGERNAAHDAFYREEIEHWRAGGFIERLDQVWSRDGGELRYVQDALLAARTRLLQWIDEGASIYVCGSSKGMAPAVHETLARVLGQARLDALTLEARYRRDVY